MEITIDLLHTLCSSGKIKWTTHVLARLQEREISPIDVKNCIINGKILENYPNDYPYPSCLVFGLTIAGKNLHAVVGVGNGFMWLITAYYPDKDKWDDNFQIRKV